MWQPDGLTDRPTKLGVESYCTRLKIQATKVELIFHLGHKYTDSVKKAFTLEESCSLTDWAADLRLVAFEGIYLFKMGPIWTFWLYWFMIFQSFFLQEGRIHGSISRGRVGRSGKPKKVTLLWIDGRTDVPTKKWLIELHSTRQTVWNLRPVKAF